MNKKLVAWGLIVILAMSVIGFWLYTSKLKLELQEYESMDYANFYFGMISEITTLETILDFEKAFMEGNGDLETFKSLIDLHNNTVLRNPGSPVDLSETESVEFNGMRHKIRMSILDFQNAKTIDERKTAIVEFEEGLKDYKQAFDTWIESENECADISGFCTER